ncbi:uncharacterized protein LOC110854693 [Folsomia candida]|uniref:Copine-D n=1 Tax=Folsomia candida TaxID=158441 RepID=A0A226EXX2_FOLCA|nr:uncharacterized protein LOC110854693 [Folsomia candida]OXA61924.1 Copine-D [Folsomia candida]
MGINAGLVIASCVIIGLAKASSPDTREVQYFIVNAYNLPRKDPFDASDPFLLIKNGSGHTVYRTDWQLNRVNATFDPVYFNVLPNEVYHIDVRDYDALTADETCGSVHVRGNNLVGGNHPLRNPMGGWVVFRWIIVPTQPPTTTTVGTTTTRTTTTEQTTTTTTTPRTSTTREPDCVRCTAPRFELAVGFLALAGILNAKFSL